MSIRTETPAVGLVRGEPQLFNIFGFGWNPSAGANTLSEVAALTAELEYDGGAVERIVVRPRVWYGTGRLVARCRLYASSAGVAVLDVGTEFGDVAVPSPAATEPEAAGDLVKSWRGYTGANIAAWSDTIKLPRGTRGLMWLSRCTAYGSQTTLEGAVDLAPASTIGAFRLGAQLASAGADARGIAFMGRVGDYSGQNHRAADAVLDTQASPFFFTPFPPAGVVPRSVRLGIKDTGNNTWSVDVYAV